MSDITTFIQAISRPHLPGVFNPWREECDTERPDRGGHRARQERLRRHFEAPNPRLIIIGEAPGYQGCRFSGIPFTSERLLFEGAIPRNEDMQGVRITTRQRPWSEPSATIVWRALYEHSVAASTILFNAFPWHPEGNAPLSNRTPTDLEKKLGLDYLDMLLKVYPGVDVAALGNIADELLRKLGTPHIKLRHPANGGARKFAAGLSEFLHCNH